MKLTTALLAAALVFFWANSTRAEQNTLRMHVINVGQAESILLEMPNHALLIDAGGEETERDGQVGSFYRDKLRNYLDAFFANNTHLNKTLYAVILSHPHKDHTRYLVDVLRRYKVRHFIEGGHPHVLDDLVKARQLVNQQGIARINVKANSVNSAQLKTWAQDIETNSGARVRFLSGRRGCNDENNDSLVMRIEFGQKSLLLTGDSEVHDTPFNQPTNEGCGGQIPYILSRYRDDLAVLDADIYKVGHHGSPNGSNKKFLEAVTPEFAVISAGHHSDRSPHKFHGWHFGHPRESLVRLLERHVTGNRTQPVNVYTLRGQFEVIQNRQVEKDIYCTCWGAKAVVFTLRNDNTQIETVEIPQ